MAFIKAQLYYIVIGFVCLGSMGMGAWAYMQGADVERKMTDINKLVNDVRKLRNKPANKRTIEAKKQDNDRQKAIFEKAKTAALALQKYNVFYEQRDGDGNITREPRKLLVPDVLPKSKSAVRIAFREAYKLAIKELYERLRARGEPTDQEIDQQITQLEQLKERPHDEDLGPWVPRAASGDTEQNISTMDRSLAELLRESASARAADEVARSIYMYADEGAFGRHDMVEKESSPSSVEVWQAQMSLWIQQDMAAAIVRCNEERAEALRRDGVKDPFWVAQMPVKRVRKLVIGDALGEGGGSNLSRETLAFSFTDIENNNRMFVVPLRLKLVVEEAALMDVLEKLCGVGFYSPISVKYKAVKPDPILLQNLHIYGDDPVVQVEIDLEGYFFREAFEEWIPRKLKEVLKRPGAKEGYDGRG